jgi:hypothetical protein
LDVEAALHETGLRSEACFLCKWIHQDLKLNKKLTGHPLAWSGDGEFPVEGKKKHLKLEGIDLTSM